uniref:Mercuric reductase n=1 Tax=mine drainage metagenome TaxID=410659 RepID=E6PGQ9_9ZZZZ
MNAPDIIVIGAGSAGFSAAIRASELGASVALVGDGTIGGTCVNVGCVPSKTLIRAAEALHAARNAARFRGMSGDAAIADWAELVAQKDELVASLRSAKYSDLLPEYENVTYLAGRARLHPESVEVNGTLLTSEQIVIATGASPRVPEIPGIDDVPWLDSTRALDLRELPSSMLVIGGGAIGCELAQMFARVGVRVTLVCRTHLLPAEERESGDVLSEYLQAEGIDVRCGVRYESVAQNGDVVTLVVRNADGRREELGAQRLLVAVGRQANSAGLGLAEVGVRTRPDGAIDVDDRMQTTRPGTYAAGDVTGRDLYVYMAAYGAKLAVDNALGENERSYDARSMPRVTFTDPQVASVGLTEAQAQAQGYEVQAVRLELHDLPRALAARDTRGFVKLVAERESGKLLGAHIVAPEGGDSIQTAVLAVKHELTVNDLADTLFPYLTNVEGIKLAALGFRKDIAKLSCCAG